MGKLELKRYDKNPILKPVIEHNWENVRVFNCAAIYLNGKVHIVYRAMGKDGVSRLGYASSTDGFQIDERLDYPIFEPSGHYFEKFGCEDPRLTVMGDRIYMTYTAFGKIKRWRKAGKLRLAQIGLTSISVEDFLEHEWNWGDRIYPFPRVDDKNAVIFPKKFRGKYVMYHRIPPNIWVGYSPDIFDWSSSTHRILMTPGKGWESLKIGAGAPPIELKEGWLLIYHGTDDNFTYRLGLALIDKKDPKTVVKRLSYPILEPKEFYEGYVVFTCGAVVLDDNLIVYYGADDRVIGVAYAELSEVLGALGV